MRAIVSAGFGEGHALPALALTRALRARGHAVTVELSERWREPVEALGAGFLPAEPYTAFPGAAPGTPGPTVVDRAQALFDVIGELGPDVVVSDLVAPAPALAAELAGVRSATLIPTLYPVQGTGLPPYPTGLAPPRTPLGSQAWRAIEPPLRAVRPATRWLRRVPGLVDAARADLGLPPLARDRPITTFGPISEELAIVATFPQLEYPRRWPAQVHVSGPMRFDLPHPDLELPEGEEPLVLVASSTTHDDRHDLVRTALGALASEPVRVLATLNRKGEAWTEPPPPNARIVDWLSYAQAMPQASAVISTGGHGTVARALAEGVPVLVCPLGADTAENGARVSWAGAGLMLPQRLLTEQALRWATRRLIADPRFTTRATALAAWARTNDGATRAAELLERYAGQ